MFQGRPVLKTCPHDEVLYPRVNNGQGFCQGKRKTMAPRRTRAIRTTAGVTTAVAAHYTEEDAEEEPFETAAEGREHRDSSDDELDAAAIVEGCKEAGTRRSYKLKLG